MTRASILADRFAALPGTVRGALWMVLAGLMFSAAAASVRQLAADFHFLQIAFFRSLFGIVFMMPWLRRVGLGALATSHLGKYAVRGVFSLGAMVLWFAGLTLMPIADATAVSFTVPLFTTIAAVLVLRERLHPRRVFALLVGFAGTLVILRPGLASIGLGAWMVIGSALCIAVAAIYVKVIARSDRPDTIAIYQLAVMLPGSLLGAMFVWRWPDLAGLFWAALMGAFATWAQRCYTRALAAAEATAVVPFDFVRLPFAAAIGYVAFRETPDLWSWVGGTIIFAATLTLARGEARARRGAR